MTPPVSKNPQHSAAIDRLINDLSLRGYCGAEISRRLAQMTPPIRLGARAVQIRIQKLNESMRLSRDEWIAHELRTLVLVQREALDAWQASCQPGETTITEKIDGAGTGGNGERLKATLRREQQSGDAAHLGNVIRASESRRKLVGLDATTSLSIRAEPMPPIDWSQVPDDMQVQFLDGTIPLAQIVAYLAEQKRDGDG